MPDKHDRKDKPITPQEDDAGRESENDWEVGFGMWGKHKGILVFQVPEVGYPNCSYGCFVAVQYHLTQALNALMTAGLTNAVQKGHREELILLRVDAADIDRAMQDVNASRPLVPDAKPTIAMQPSRPVDPAA